MRIAYNLGLAVAAMFIVVGCSYEVEIGDREVEPDLKAEADFDGLKKVPGTDWYKLSQGWNDELRRAYWFTPQGSALIPYDWFLNLEMAERNCVGTPDTSLNKGGWKRFADPAHLRSLGYTPAPADPDWNPDGLPIGFAKTLTADGDFMGPTCAACHTNQMVLGGRKVLVDGAPTLADLQALNVGLANALCSMDHRTIKKRNDKPEIVKAADAQYDRFARRVLKGGYSPESKTALFEAVKQQRLRIHRRNVRNYSKKTDIFPAYGKGRLDALGAILNEVAVFATKETDNIYPANAPVSYPFLWGTPQSDVVQWNGAVDNQRFGLGPLGRNVGEVVGVYGHVDVTPKGDGVAFARQALRTPGKLAPPLIGKRRGAQLGGYDSSVKMLNIGSIEHWLSALRSPKWPEKVLGTLDGAKIARGKAIYLGETDTGVKCAACHTYVARADQGKPYQSRMIPVAAIGTDPVAAGNFIVPTNPTSGRRWKTGQLKGTRKGILTGDRYGDFFAHRAEPLRTVVLGVIAGDAFFDGIGGIYRSRSNSNETDPPYPAKDKFLRYKARPLTGIWATAPYLHNGSVASLRQMLTPDAERAAHICVGNPEFDPKDVGFVSALGPDNRCAPDAYGSTLLDTSKFGNSNKGHSRRIQGVELSEADKDALIEFLKSI
ncbi:MAG: hypothetical protein ACI9JL_003700 [Paracoccaceae bacterium]|jgi:cytochrome c peroxidase